MLPAVASEKLAEYCDIFCERGYFDIETSRRILTAAKGHGLKLRMHVDQLTNSGGAALAAELGAITADHLEQTEDDGIAALKRAERSTSAAARIGLRAGQDALSPRPRHDRCRPGGRAGDGFQSRFIADAIDSDGALAGGTQMKMTPAEGVTAATINAAYSLQRGDEIGSLEPGKRANFAIFDCADYRELACYFGIPQTHAVYVRGERVPS